MPRDISHLLITGGAGFIGSTLVRVLLDNPDVTQLTVLDKLTYAGRYDHLPVSPKLAFVHGDITDRPLVSSLLQERGITGVLNLAAESHVDRSIACADDFIATNIVGTANLLDACRFAGLPLFQCSTDEVYGSIAAPARFTEFSPLRPSSPYSASKTSADLLCLAAHHTYGQDIVISRGTNTYGPRQHPEKLIPRMVWCALRNEPLPVYGNGLQVRDWMHVEDHARGILAAFLHGRPGHVYNLGANEERENLSLVLAILELLQKPSSLIRHVTDRLGHDIRYAIDADKARTELGWRPIISFEEGFSETVTHLRRELEPG